MKELLNANRPSGRGTFGSIQPVLWLFTTVLSVFSVGNTARAQQTGEIVGVPWTGEQGITETVGQIMARDHLFPPPTEPRTTGKPKRISPDRSKLPQAPDSLGPLAAWPPLPPGVSPVTPRGYQDRNPQALGTSFDAVVISESGYIPPDTIGDVGPTQIIAAANGRIKLFSKTGTLGALNASMNNFFSSVNTMIGSSVVDPVLRYDRLTDRWFVIGITTNIPNRIVLAVSAPGTITDASSFTFFFFQQDLVGPTPNADSNFFADYCTLGVDANALYIGCRMFSPNFYGCTGWVVRKSSMTSGGPIVVTAFRQMTTTTTGPDAPRGVSNDDATATEGYFIGADVATFARLVIRRISTPGGTPTMSGNLNVSVTSTAAPVNVPAQGTTTAIEAVDDRLYAAHVRKNRATGTSSLWTSHAINTNSSGTGTSAGDRDSMRWYEIINITTTPVLRQSSTLFDSSATTPRWYWMGSCNVSGQGHMALGASFAAADEFVGCATAGRLATDGLATIQAPTDMIAGAGAYNLVAQGRNRWGDYSHTVVDPTDDMTMWTFQEYCNTVNSWAVRVVQLRAPAPATPVSCSPSSIAQGAANTNIVLTGTSTAGSGFFDPDPTFPYHIAAVIGGTGVTVNSITWTSPTQLTLNVNVSAVAALGARSITIANPDGQAAASTSGILTVAAGGVCTPPAVTTQPINTSACLGGNASFPLVASGTSLSYQWRRGSTNITDGGTISGATTPTLSITGIVAGDVGVDYNCLVTNVCGSAMSHNAALAVNSSPAITSPPANTSACVSGVANFGVIASGTPAPTFQWRRGTTNLVNGGTIAGATSDTLNIIGVAAGDAGADYNCVVTNTCGSATSTNATLTVNTAPAFTTQPSNASACAGTNASFSVAATGSPAPTFQWRRGTINLVNGGTISGATSPTLTITGVVAGDADTNYNCVVTNLCTSVASSNATLAVNAGPSITGQPASLTRCAGTPASFSVTATGTPAPTFQWRKNASNIVGATSSSYTIPSVATTDTGNYDCVVSNVCGSSTSNVGVLTVNTAPAITTQPLGATRCQGDSYTLAVVVTGVPAPTYQWRRNGTDISGETHASLVFPSLTLADGGNYECFVTNSCGRTVSVIATIAIETAPSVTTQPIDQTVTSGASASFSVVASGTPTLSYEWRKDSVRLPNGGNISGADTPTLTINPATESDAGNYNCIIANSCGSEPSNRAALTVNPACITDIDDGSGTGTPDGGTTIDDLLYYLFIFEAGDIRADVDDGSGTGTLDGGLTIDDLLYYLFRFELGC